MSEKIIMKEVAPGLYQHYKGGQYRVLDNAIHSETLETMTVYRPLYGEGKLWVRPAVMFNEMVDVEGVLVPRFTRVGD